jgi:N-acetylglucosaminyldiphosphoundecaprenol N-acetyl-beta-D-mannosaminyltransferase
MKTALRYIQDNLKQLCGKYICISNVHTTVMSYENADYCRIQNEAALALPDGKPLSVVCRKRGFAGADRVTGPDLMKEIFECSREQGYTHYFYGSTPETLELLEKKLTQQYGLSIAGMYSPPFRKLTKEEDREIVEQMNAAGADFVWVGLGAPKQEQWMYEHQDKINGLMIGVGAGFDYFAGNIKRAPMWMQKCSLEWLYRLMQDPRRLFKRYLVTNTKFLWLIARGK